MSYGSFSQTITLPIDVKAYKAEAVFEDGVLKLTVPKAEVVKPKQIKVKATEKRESKAAPAKK